MRKWNITNPFPQTTYTQEREAHDKLCIYVNAFIALADAGCDALADTQDTHFSDLSQEDTGFELGFACIWKEHVGFH